MSILRLEREKISAELIRRRTQEYLRPIYGDPGPPQPKPGPPKTVNQIYNNVSSPSFSLVKPSPVTPTIFPPGGQPRAASSSLGCSISAIIILVLIIIFISFAFGFSQGLNNSRNPTNSTLSLGFSCQTSFRTCPLLNPGPVGANCFCPNQFSSFNDSGVVSYFCFSKSIHTLD